MAYNFWTIVIVSLTVGWVITTWIRAKHGYPVEDTFGGHVSKTSEEAALKALIEKDLQPRDASIADLQQRVQVLERIVTDRPGRLHDEIERLNA